MTTINSATPLEAARTYMQVGMCPIPVAHREKAPTINGWPSLRIEDGDLPRYFGADQQNIGIILGEASSGLVDIDLDSPQAVRLTR